jgi:hypothetical protein
LARWSVVENYSPRWSGRASIIARFLNDCATVSDLGAGTQVLRHYIKGKYSPVDFVSLWPDTTIIDFDAAWSIDDLPKSEGLAMAGLLEHLKDPIDTIHRLAPVGKVWAVSYMDRRSHSERGLVSLKTLEQTFHKAGFRVDAVDWWRNQKVYRLIRA